MTFCCSQTSPPLELFQGTGAGQQPHNSKLHKALEALIQWQNGSPGCSKWCTYYIQNVSSMVKYVKKYIKVHGPDETAPFKHRRTVRVAEFWQMPSKIQWECQNAASLCQRRESHQGRKIRMVEDASVRQTGQSRLHASRAQGAGMYKMLRFDGLGLSHMQLLFRCVCMQLILSIILTISSYYHSFFASLNSHSRHCVNMVCVS